MLRHHRIHRIHSLVLLIRLKRLPLPHQQHRSIRIDNGESWPFVLHVPKLDVLWIGGVYQEDVDYDDDGLVGFVKERGAYPEFFEMD